MCAIESSSFDFGFWILDFGLWKESDRCRRCHPAQSKIQIRGARSAFAAMKIQNR
jgi:hypothetical protein